MSNATDPPPTQTSGLDSVLLGIVRLGTFLCLAGWTWAHFYWEGPYGVLLWQDATYEFASQLGISWEEFVGSGADDGWVQRWLGRVWWLYLACAVLSLTAKKRSWWQLACLVLGSGLLVIMSYAKYVASQQQLPMFVEHGSQMLTPLLLVAGLSLGIRHRLTVTIAIVAMIMTFAGHGCYALGSWPTPANFYGMTTLVLGVEYETARAILRTCGVLDFVVCVGIFIPYVRIPCAGYAAAWGFLTAIARPVAGMSLSLNYWGADQFIHEAILRAPHSLIPLYLFCLWWGRAKEVARPNPQGSSLAVADSKQMPLAVATSNSSTPY